MESLHLVPGGRYLVTGNKTIKRFALWDLGLPRTKPQQPTIVAEVELEREPQVLNVSFRGSLLKVGIKCQGRRDMYVRSFILAPGFPLAGLSLILSPGF